MTKIFRKLLIVGCLFFSYNSCYSAYLEKLDGMENVIDGHLINKIAFNLRMLDQFSSGIDGTGYYEFENKKWTLNQLAQYESDAKRQSNTILIEKVHNAFLKVHSDCKIAIEFLESYKQIFKRYDLSMLEKSMKVKCRSNEIFQLFRSGSYYAYYDSINNFNALNCLVSDLMELFTDFIRNFPKAYKQFEELNSNTHKSYGKQLKRRIHRLNK